MNRREALAGLGAGLVMSTAGLLVPERKDMLTIDGIRRAVAVLDNAEPEAAISRISIGSIPNEGLVQFVSKESAPEMFGLWNSWYNDFTYDPERNLYWRHVRPGD